LIFKATLRNLKGIVSAFSIIEKQYQKPAVSLIENLSLLEFYYAEPFPCRKKTGHFSPSNQVSNGSARKLSLNI